MEEGTINRTIDRYARIKKGSWFSQFQNGSNPWMARYVYGLMFLVATLFAWAVRDYGHTALKEMESKPDSFDYSRFHIEVDWLISFDIFVPLNF